MTPAVKRKTGLITAGVAAGTGLAYGAITARLGPLPAIPKVGAGITYGVPVVGLGYAIKNLPIMAAGAVLTGIGFAQESEVWFETKEGEEIRVECEKLRKKMEAEFKKKKAEKEKAAGWPEDAASADEPVGEEIYFEG